MESGIYTFCASVLAIQLKIAMAVISIFFMFFTFKVS